MRIRVTFIDDAPAVPELGAAVPFEVALIRRLPGPDRPDYWLAALDHPLRCRGREVTHPIVASARVYQIARNVVRDHRRQAANPVIALAGADPADDEDHLSQLRCRACGWLDEMIRSLPEGYRGAVQLAEIEGLSQQEVADRLGLSLSGTKSRIQRGRAMPKDALEACCHFEIDGRSNVMDYEPKPDRRVCRDCGD